MSVNRVWMMSAFVPLTAACAVTQSPTHVAHIGGAIEVTLTDTSPSTRAAVSSACGRLPGIAKVERSANDPDTLRFLHPNVGFRDPRMVAVFRCLRAQPHVLMAGEPL